MPLRKFIRTKYPLPASLEGRCTPSVFTKWIHSKAGSLIELDRKRGKLYALNVTETVYEEEIYKAVLKSGPRDPYTGDLFAWEQIGKWDTTHKHPDGYERQFSLMPTVDHVTPDKLEFEICTFEVNTCKSYLGPEEFIQFCNKVAKNHSLAPEARRRRSNRKRLRTAAKSKGA
jgi:hypothetical protein